MKIVLFSISFLVLALFPDFVFAMDLGPVFMAKYGIVALFGATIVEIILIANKELTVAQGFLCISILGAILLFGVIFGSLI